MATQIGELGVTFPDTTVQTTAAIAGAPGFGGFTNMVVFTTSGTWVIPSGVTKCKVTVVGGGGGTGLSGISPGGTSSFGAYCSATGGSGGGGIGVSGTLNITGGYGIFGGGTVNGNGFSVSLLGGSTVFGNGSYGAGAPGVLVVVTVDAYAPAYPSAGAGGTAIKIISGLESGFVTVTVGQGGFVPSYDGTSGNAGVVIVEY